MWNPQGVILSSSEKSYTVTPSKLPWSLGNHGDDWLSLQQSAMLLEKFGIKSLCPGDKKKQVSRIQKTRILSLLQMDTSYECICTEKPCKYRGWIQPYQHQIYHLSNQMGTYLSGMCRGPSTVHPSYPISHLLRDAPLHQVDQGNIKVWGLWLVSFKHLPNRSRCTYANVFDTNSRYVNIYLYVYLYIYIYIFKYKCTSTDVHSTEIYFYVFNCF